MKPTLTSASSFTNPCGLTPPTLNPSSLTVAQNSPSVSITATGCSGGIIQYFNNFGTPAGVNTVAPGSAISIPTSQTGLMILSTACSANGCLSDVSSATITITASTSSAPPVVSNTIPNQTATVGTNFVYVIPANTFSDPNNDPLTLSVSTLPSGLFFNGSVITGPLSQTGSSTILVKATNTHSLSVSTSFNLNVLPGTPMLNQPPTVVGGGITSPQTATLDAAFSTPTAYAFTDPENGPLTYSSSSLPPGLSINPSTGIISGTPTLKGQFGVTVVATDNGGLNTNAGFLLNVILNPAINYPPYVVATGINTPQAVTKGTAVSIPTDYAFADPEGRPFSYISSPLPAGLTLNPTTGLISGTPTNYGTFGITVGATDDGGNTAYSGFYLTVNLNPGINEPPYVVGSGITTPQSTYLNDGYNFPTATAFADPEGRTLTYVSSPLAPGLTLNPTTGVISGTPVAPGQYGITVGATDDGGNTVYSGYFLNVVLDPAINYPPIIVGSGLSSPQTGTKGVALSIPTAYAFKDPEGRPLGYLSSPLPGGLSINPVTGEISGTPTSYGTFGITVGATDDGGNTVYSGFYLTINLNPAINEPPYVVGSGITTPQSGTIGISLTIPTAYAFSDPEGRTLTYISSPLPAGLTLNPANGVISGTPTNYGTFGITVGATDDGSNTAYSGFYLTIYLNPAINEPPYVVGSGITTPQSGTVGVSTTIPTAYAFSDPEGRTISYISSPLPPGLSLNTSTGEVSGTPTQPGYYGITIGAVDDGGNTVYSGFYYTVYATGGGRLAAGNELKSSLTVTVFGNPTANESVEVEVRGVSGQALSLKTIDGSGQKVSETAIEQAGETERIRVQLGRSAGMYFLQVNTSTENKLIKILKQ
ncbi:MAG: hypothetical protein BGO59_03270 [Spirosoma sp. 48-14]|nr:MAG: hypothetical protein BGO59_03270 [Spirosoma sp. 48-14]